MAKQIAEASCNARRSPQKAPTPEHLQGLVGAVLSIHKPKTKFRGRRASAACQEHKGAACGQGLSRGRMSSSPSGQWGSCSPLDHALHQSLNQSFGFLKPLWTSSCYSHNPSFCCSPPHAAARGQPGHVPIPELCSSQSSPCSSLSTSSALPWLFCEPCRLQQVHGSSSPPSSGHPARESGHGLCAAGTSDLGSTAGT